jgi:hypothetical protein
MIVSLTGALGYVTSQLLEPWLGPRLDQYLVRQLGRFVFAPLVRYFVAPLLAPFGIHVEWVDDDDER